MSRNNDVFQVLVTSGNQAVLPAGQDIGTLAVGQIGVFDNETGLSIDGTNLNRNFFLAVGVDRDGDTLMDDINKSAGQYIQRINMRFYSFRPHTAAQPMIAELTGFKAECDTDYALKLEFRNQEIYRRQGYNQFSKTYAVRTGCCDDCSNDCPTGSCQELGVLLTDEVNAETDGLVNAELFVNQGSIQITGEPTADGNITVTANGESQVIAILDADTASGVATKVAAAFSSSTTNLAVANGDTVTFTSLATISTPTGTVTYTDTGTTGATATVTDFASVVVTSSTLNSLTGVCPGVRLTTVPLAINKFCDINLKYYRPRQTVIIPSLVDGFNCNGTITITQEAANEEGSGYDIRQKEYHAGGWNGRPGPYRVSEATGTAQNGFEYFADQSVKYDQFWLTYDLQSVAGWQEHFNNLATCIAIPDSDGDTINGLVDILDNLLTPLGFDALSDDSGLANATSTVVEPTSEIDDPAQDGIA